MCARRPYGDTMSLRRLFELQLSADFTNMLTGSSGGDARKTLDVARDAGPSERPKILLIFFVDRIMSLAGILTLLLARVGAHVADGTARLRNLAFFAGAVLGPALVLHGLRYFHAPLALWTARLDANILTRGPSRLAKVLNMFLAVHELWSRLVSAQPKRMLLALALSVAENGVAMVFFMVLTRVILDRDVSYWAVAIVFPLGILTTRVPAVSPAGLGVGHVAFERLFLSAGLVGGATIFNIYWVGQLMPRLLFGVYPFLRLRKKRALELFRR